MLNLDLCKIHQYAGPEGIVDVITEWLTFSNKWYLNSSSKYLYDGGSFFSESR
jgi:hypothetical protein